MADESNDEKILQRFIKMLWFLHTQAMDKLLAARAKPEAEMQQARDEEKRLRKQITDQARKDRNHRICTRGAMLESFLPEPERLSDGAQLYRYDTQHLLQTDQGAGDR